MNANKQTNQLKSKQATKQNRIYFNDDLSCNHGPCLFYAKICITHCTYIECTYVQCAFSLFSFSSSSSIACIHFEAHCIKKQFGTAHWVVFWLNVARNAICLFIFTFTNVYRLLLLFSIFLSLKFCWHNSILLSCCLNSKIVLIWLLPKTIFFFFLFSLPSAK